LYERKEEKKKLHTNFTFGIWQHFWAKEQSFVVGRGCRRRRRQLSTVVAVLLGQT
jgi:hypothetical protein